MHPVSPDPATLLALTLAAQERQAALLAGAIAAQSALVALLVDGGLLTAQGAAEHFGATRGRIPVQHAAAGAAEAIDSVLRVLADAYGAVPPAPEGSRPAPALSVIAGGRPDPAG